MGDGRVIYIICIIYRPGYFSIAVYTYTLSFSSPSSIRREQHKFEHDRNVSLRLLRRCRWIYYLLYILYIQQQQPIDLFIYIGSGGYYYVLALHRAYILLFLKKYRPLFFCILFCLDPARSIQSISKRCLIL